jgi:hypothetical protein
MLISEFVLMVALIIYFILLPSLRTKDAKSKWMGEDDLLPEILKKIEDEKEIRRGTNSGWVVGDKFDNLEKHAWVITETRIYWQSKSRRYEPVFFLPQVKEIPSAESRVDIEVKDIHSLGGYGNVTLSREKDVYALKIKNWHTLYCNENVKSVFEYVYNLANQKS